MRLLVCGGRDYSNASRVGLVLTKIHQKRPITCVIHGGARGADKAADLAARAMGLPCEVYQADWRGHGKKAGPIRNQRMIDEGKPDGVLAFPGGRGTTDMVSRAREAGIKVMEVA